MPLDPSKLTMVKDRGCGHLEARCPACAETGQDKQGVHLKVYKDGQFACVVQPGKEGAAHRKRIFALAGLRLPLKPVLLRAPPRALVKAVSIKALLQAKTPANQGQGENEDPF